MSQTHTSDFQVKDFLAPKYWLTWLGLGLLRACNYLPYSWLIHLGTGLGWLGFYFMPGRRRITRTNVRIAFPELDEQTQRKIVKQSFYSATTAIFESALSWWGSDKKLKPLYQVEGLEHVQAALHAGNGVLLLGGHYTTVEISARLFAYCASNTFPTYKRAHNRLFEAVMTQQRRRVSAGLIKSSDMRAILRSLRWPRDRSAIPLRRWPRSER